MLDKILTEVNRLADAASENATRLYSEGDDDGGHIEWARMDAYHTVIALIEKAVEEEKS